MKLQRASRKEIRRIALGTLVCDGIMIAGLFLLSQFDMGTFDLPRILLGAACGSVIAIANFTILCLTVQIAAEMDNKRKMKAKFQLSYNIRLALQAGWVVACFAIPQIHFIAGAAPILFPKLTILYLQFTGRLFPAGSRSTADSQADTGEVPEPEENESR